MLGSMLGIAGLLSGCGAPSPAKPVADDSVELGGTKPQPRVQPDLPVAFSGRVEHEGVVVDVAISPLAEGRSKLTAYEGARLRFQIRDTASAAPLAGVYPAAWMQARKQPAGAAVDPRACAKMIEGFVSGSIFTQPEVDLNTFMVVVLNDHASISVVDPRFGFGGSKLLTMIPLSGRGHDWALRGDQSELFVSIPDAGTGAGELAVIETYGYRVVAQVDIGEAAGRLLLQADEQYIWAAGGQRLVALDIDDRQIAASLEIGGGEHDLAQSADSRFVFVSDATANTVTVVDTRTLSVHGVVETGWEPVSLDYSSTAGALFVSERGEGRISIIDPVGSAGTPAVVGSMPAEAGIGELRFAPGGRFGLVVNPRQDLLHIFDAASRRILRTGEVAPQPDHIAFSTELAYIRHAGSDTVYMLHLDELGVDGAPLQIVDFPAGQDKFGPRSSPAATMVRAPGENAMLVAHPIDRAVYYYKEGMAAPMGQFANYQQPARAVLTIDRSLKEVERRGVYETSAVLGPPGTYDLALYMDSPRLLHCFEVEVEPNLERERELGPPVRVEWSLPSEPGKVGEPIELSVRLFARRTDEPLLDRGDVTLALNLMTPDNWQGRLHAEHRGGGEYRAVLTPTLPGPYQLRVSTEGLTVEQSPVGIVVALAD